ncbi:MAG: hypothetical protein ACOX4R_08855 [Lentihominibacter sp.]|jgi:hypothetical protein
MCLLNIPFGFITILIIAVAVIILAIIYFAAPKKEDKKEPPEAQYASSQTLTDELNKERKKEGKYTITPINSGSTSTSTYARKDKSYSNTIDFFVKLFKK